MGIQATRDIDGKKQDTVFVARAGGDAVFPDTGEVSVVSIPAAADEHRLADIERAVHLCLDYARDTNLYSSAGSVAVVTTLNGGKAGIEEIGIATNVIVGQVGIMITGTTRALGQRQWIENLHIQTLEFMREQNRLVA